VLTGEARTVRRRAQLRLGALGLCGALVVGAGVMVGAAALRPQPVAPGAQPSASATPATVSVTWNPTPAVAEATAGFALPACGDTFAPAASTVGAVTLSVQALYFAGGDDGRDSISVVPIFSSDGPPITFLADSSSYVITQDGVVVAESLTFENLDLTGISTEGSSEQTVFGTVMCDAQSAIDAAWKSVGLEPNATDSMTDAEKAAAQSQLDTFYTLQQQVVRDHTALPSGTYEVYAVTPIIFGDQLAAAQQIAATGFHNPGYIESSIGSTDFRYDPRISPYCSSLDGNGYCNVPQDVLREVLTFEVDPADIDTTPSGVAISAPTTVTVP
jgi:hypothetical protein